MRVSRSWGVSSARACRPRNRPVAAVRSIRAKLTVLVLASVGMAVAVVSGVLAWRDGQRETHAAYGPAVRRAAKVLAATSEEATARATGRAPCSHPLDRLMPDVAYARVERANGALLAETGSGARLIRDVAGRGGRPRLDRVAAALAHGRGDRADRLCPPAGRPRGAAGQLGAAARGASPACCISLAAGLTAALAGLAVAARLQRRISGPVVALTDAMGGAREPRLQRAAPTSWPTTRSATWSPASTTCWPRSAAATKAGRHGGPGAHRRRAHRRTEGRQGGRPRAPTSPSPTSWPP